MNNSNTLPQNDRSTQESDENFVDFDRSATSHLTPPTYAKGTIFGEVYLPLTKEEIDKLTTID